MGNEMKVVVTRAPRIRKALFADVDAGSYYLGVVSQAENLYAIYEKANPALIICQPFKLPYDIEFGKNEVVPFDSFEDMCKWVAGGKKVEDLQGDSMSEWASPASLEIGQYATMVEEFSTIPKEGLVIKTHYEKFPFTHLENGDNYNISLYGYTSQPMVWPIRFDLGDTISLTAP